MFSNGIANTFVFDRISYSVIRLSCSLHSFYSIVQMQKKTIFIIHTCYIQRMHPSKISVTQVVFALIDF